MLLQPQEIIFCNGVPSPYYKVKWECQMEYEDLQSVLLFFYDLIKKQKRCSNISLKNIDGTSVTLDELLLKKKDSVLTEFLYNEDSNESSVSEEDIDDEPGMEERPRELIEELYNVTKWKSLTRRRKYKSSDSLINNPLKYIKMKKKSMFTLGSLIETIREISTRLTTVEDKSIEEEEIVICDNINELAKFNISNLANKSQESPNKSQPPSARSTKDKNSETNEAIKDIRQRDIYLEDEKLEKELLLKKKPENFSRLPSNLSKFIAMKQIKKVETAMLKINNERNTYSLEELREHKNENDAWVAIDGVIYDVTDYLNYHPGGKAILKNMLGKDATAVFNRCHSWVRHDTILNDRVVGVLDKSG